MIKSVWVLGAGKFGLKAVERIKQIYSGVNLTVVDQKREIPQAVTSVQGVAYGKLKERLLANEQRL